MRRIVAAVLAVAVPGCFIDFGELQSPGNDAGGGQGGSAAIGGAGADAGGSGGSAGSNCTGGAPTVDYVISRVASAGAVIVDGNCNEPIWTNAPPIPFKGPSTSDNTVNCRLAWAEGSPPRVFGCCENADTDLRASVTTKDGDVFNDDSIEYFLRPNEEAILNDPLTVKWTVNILGTTLDYDGSPPYDKSYDSSFVAAAKITGTLNDTDIDTGYTIEWSHELLYQPAFGARYRCGFAMNDLDASGWSAAMAFPTTAPGLNVPSSWGLCAYACPVDPG